MFWVVFCLILSLVRLRVGFWTLFLGRFLSYPIVGSLQGLVLDVVFGVFCPIVGLSYVLVFGAMFNGGCGYPIVSTH